MQKRNLAIEPLHAPEPQPAIPQVEQPAQNWNQEEEAFRNRRNEIESAQERVQRLLAGIDFKKLVF